MDAVTNMAGLAAETRPLGAPNLRALGAGSSPEQIADAARQFEGMVLGQLLRPMIESVEQDPLFGGGFGEETFRSLLVDELGKSIAGSGGLGIADSIRGQLLAMQESAQSGLDY